jgi:hypothetical protein
LELVVTPGVADQLPVAVGSPIPSIKDEYYGPLVKVFEEFAASSPLIRQLEARHLPTLTQDTARFDHALLQRSLAIVTYPDGTKIFSSTSTFLRLCGHSQRMQELEWTPVNLLLPGRGNRLRVW